MIEDYTFVRPGDTGACLQGSRKACERVYFTYYLWPRFQKWLEEFKQIQTPIPWNPPVPRPDPSPMLMQELITVLLAPHFAEPQPQPSLPYESRLRMTIKFRDALQEFVKVLDKDIRKLEKLAKLKH